MKMDVKLLVGYIVNFVIAAIFIVLGLTDFSIISSVVKINKLPSIFLLFTNMNLNSYDNIIVFGLAILWAVFFVATLMVIIFNKRPKNVPHLIIGLFFGALLVFEYGILTIYGQLLAAAGGRAVPKSFVFEIIQMVKDDPTIATKLIVPGISVVFGFAYPFIWLFIADIVLFFKSIFGKTKDDEDDEDEDEDEEDDEEGSSKKKASNEPEKYYNGIEFFKAFSYYYNYQPKTVLSGQDIDKFVERAKKDTIIVENQEEVPSYKKEELPKEEVPAIENKE